MYVSCVEDGRPYRGLTGVNDGVVIKDGEIGGIDTRLLPSLDSQFHSWRRENV